MNNNRNSDPDRFNIVNISNVYKRDKNEPEKENNENKGKEITSVDILGDKLDNKLSEDLKKDDNKPLMNSDIGGIKNEGLMILKIKKLFWKILKQIMLRILKKKKM